MGDCHLFGEGPDYKFNHLTIEDGLSQSSVNSIIQDSRGLMWFGTIDGLNRYDGYDFKIFLPVPGDPSSISDNFIQVIYEDRDGDIWVGTRKGLNKFLRDTETFVRYRKGTGGLMDNNILSIYQDKEGFLWLGANSGGVHKFDPESGTAAAYMANVNIPNSLSSNQVTYVYVDSVGVVWVGTRNAGLNRFVPEDDGFISYRYNSADPSTLSSDEVTSVVEDTEGYLWIGTRNGLNRLDLKTNRFTRFKSRLNHPESISSNIVTALHLTPRGILMVATEKGFNRFNSENESFQRYLNDPNNPTSLSNNLVATIYEDPFSVLWVGSLGGGVSHYAPGRYKFAAYRSNPRQPETTPSGKLVLCLFEDRQGYIWVGTNLGLNRFDRRSQTFKAYRSRPGDPHSLSEDYVISIFEDRKGRFWVGTWDGGLNRFDRETGTFKRYLHDENNLASLSNNIVRVIFEDHLGEMWLGTWGGGINRFDRENERFIHYQNIPGDETSISGNMVVSMCEDKDGNLWVGTRVSGLNRFVRGSGTFVRYVAPDDTDDNLSEGKGAGGLGHNSIMSLHPSANGILWIGTLGGGLNKYDPKTDSFTYFQKKDGLPNDTIWGILEDDRGYLWLSTNVGLSRMDPNAETFRNYYDRDGLQSNEFNLGAYYKMANGELAFGGIEGFNLFIPDQIARNLHVPDVIITGFNLKNKPVPIGPDSPLKKAIGEVEEIRLSHRDYLFSFEFAALDYYYPEANEYAYMMEGLDKDWIHSGNIRFATYTTLDPGSYIFKVKGSNNDGVWNDTGTSLRIIITPPFWLTWWFRGVLAAVMVLLVLLVFRMRTRGMRKRTRQLEEINQELEQQMFERRQAEENLKRSERRLRTFLQTASEGFLEADNDGFIMDVNPEMCAILGRPREKILGSNIFDYVHTEGIETVSFHMKMRQKGQSSAYELTMLQPDHTQVHCLINAAPVYNDKKEVRGSFALITDITDIVKAEEELTRTKNYLKDVIDSLSSMLITIDRDALITQWNRGAEQFFGIKEEDAVSRSVWKVAPFLQPYRKQLGQVFKQRKPVELHRESIELYPGQGHKVYLDIFMYPLVYTGLEGVVIQVDDVTEFEKKDQQLIQAQKMEIVGNLAGGLAHDFNNVLGGIVGSTSLLQYVLESGKIDIGDLKSRIDTIEKSAERAVDLVKQLLTLSRKNEPAFSPVDLNIALKHVKKICQNTFDKSVEMDISSYKGDALVWADATQLEQVLLNLCINASHAMTIMRGDSQKQGGTLSVTISTFDTDKTFRDRHPQATELHYWNVEVADNGIGMDSEILSKIFDPFFTTKSERKGTGLGLAMVYYIVQQHKGFILVYSEPDLGTTFNVYLPRVEDEKILPRETKAQESLVHGSGMILMIDDEEHLRITTSEILKSCGYEVITASDGIKGISAYSERQTDINMVLLDMAMPIMSGREVYKELRKINPQIKVLLTSGFKEDERVRQVIELGVNGFIQKPFSMIDLSKKVADIVSS
jgi:PAS domain S-box-containing protein